jgi:hypothetical protein
MWSIVILPKREPAVASHRQWRKRVVTALTGRVSISNGARDHLQKLDNNLVRRS